MLFNLAKHCKPSMIFFDEMEDLCGNRNDQDGHRAAMKGVLLTETQRLKEHPQVYFLGATNRVGGYNIHESYIRDNSTIIIFRNPPELLCFKCSEKWL